MERRHVGVDVLLAADAILLAISLYDYGVSQHAKAWIDLIMTDPRALATEGGLGTPCDGWDHSPPYLRRILADVWRADPTVVEREFTLVGVNPALDVFTDQAAELHPGALASPARPAGHWDYGHGLTTRPDRSVSAARQVRPRDRPEGRRLRWAG